MKSSSNKSPRYPIYILSKGRWDRCLTARFLIEDKVDFQLVIERSELKKYKEHLPHCQIRVLPKSATGRGGVPVRNWIWEDSIKRGFERHWILDDNIQCIYHRYNARRVWMNSGRAFQLIEDFVDRYENIGLAGMNYGMFVPDRQKYPPFVINVHVYSNILILNELPLRWRGTLNEDTDLSLRVLASGLCTILFNAFLAQKTGTMQMKGGNTDMFYHGDGRLKMARSLERVWPHVVETKRRFQRPQHVVRDAWRKFDTPLKLKEGLKLSDFEGENQDLKLEKQKAEIIGSRYRKLFERYQKEKGNVTPH